MISVVIPAFNEAENIRSTLDDARAALAQAGFPEDYEIIVVDDHSTDRTFEVVAGTGDARIRCLRLSRRSGSHVALRAALAEARGDAVLCLSADGQDDPHALAEMVRKWKAGAQIVWALRAKRDEPLGYKLFALVFYKLIEWTGAREHGEFDLTRADFDLLDRRVVDAINSCPERNTSLAGLVAWMGFRQEAVTYDRRPRKSGVSKWNTRSRMNLAWNWIIAFSGMPLRLITVMGLLTAGLGFLYAIFLFFYTLLGYAKPGFAETVVLLLVLSGIQLTMLGVIGEYLWRNIDESRRRPLYFVENRSGQR
jgi:polyisoprenyl-phosphate glycosyltransferase